ncbi:hypothetical protein [Pseudoalteromonas obscura]|uniref:Glycosyl hydrolase n=1 Tax=Pseudoalteromonas obscura TaxID=3048491 RepID=A0ABT7EPG2_9GAMM|nr:hypothetical protein [Pseudoalteromonas sp. P94(2023)]MDK2596939.1 hypothetical protein [Pseudoalteromonas sp. P94(2023)]
MKTKKIILASIIGSALAAIVLATYHNTHQPSLNNITPKIKVNPKNIREPDRTMQSLIRLNPNQEVDIQAKYEAVFTQIQAYKDTSGSEFTWESLGPNRVGGRTRTLVFHPQDPDIMFAAGISGGIFKSIDAGSNWLPIANDLPSMAISTLVFDPKNSQHLYAGSGEGVYVGRGFTNSVGFAGDGIMTSKDGGQTWQQLESTNNNADFQYVNKLRFGNKGKLYAVTNTGVWISDDKGVNWQLSLDQQHVVGGCLELAISPLSDEQDRILASCGNFADGGAVYLSTDSGTTWRSVIEHQNQGRTTLAFAPSDPKIVYAMSAFNAHGRVPHALQGIYKSTDGGENWILITGDEHPQLLGRYVLSNALTINCQNPENSFIYGQGWFDNTLAIDPVNPDIIWTGGVELMRSIDSGQTWQQMSFYYHGADAPHVDHHGLYFHPNYDGINETRLFNVNDGGIAMTSNPLANGLDACEAAEPEIEWQHINEGYNVTQFYHGDVSQDGSRILGGAQDNGSLLFSPDMGWQKVGGGDGGYAFFIDNERMTASTQNGNVYLVSENGPDFKFLPENESSLFITPYVIDPNNRSRIWLGGQSLWRLDDIDEGEFTRASIPFTTQYRRGITALAVQPGNSNRVIFAQTDGKLKRLNNALSADNTTEPEDISFADFAYVREIHYSIHDDKHMYAVASTFGENHIWKSEDLGTTWAHIDGEDNERFPDLPAHSLAELKEDPERLFVGTDFGVYHTEDGGESWQPFIHGLPNVAVYRLVLRRIEHINYLYAFTYGRGVYRIALDTANIAPDWRGEEPEYRIKVNQTISIDLTQYIHDNNGDPITFSADQLPSGFTLTNDGVLSGTLTNEGAQVLSFVASDGARATQLSFTIEVNDKPDNKQDDKAAPQPEPEPQTTPNQSSNLSSSGSFYHVICLVLFSICAFRKYKS